MTEPLFRVTQDAGLRGGDITEGYGTQILLDDLMGLIDSYDVTADPANNRYIIQDDQHQYGLEIIRVYPEEDKAFVSAEEANRFANQDLEDIYILSDEDFKEPDPRDEAIFGDGSTALKESSERAPDRARE